MRTAELLELIRNGENSGVEFKRDDIRPEQLAKEIVNMETLPVAGTSIDSLDLDRLNFYLASIIEDPELPSSGEQWIERLLGLGNKVCSIAGLVCFGIRPRRYLPQAGLRLMIFAGARTRNIRPGLTLCWTARSQAAGA